MSLSLMRLALHLDLIRAKLHSKMLELYKLETIRFQFSFIQTEPNQPVDD